MKSFIIIIVLLLINQYESSRYLNDGICRILTLSGGGAHGAFQAGVIKILDEMGHNWDIITGISVGSLNGILMGMYPKNLQMVGVQELEDLWMNITSDDVYKWNWNPISAQSLYTNEPLNKTVHREIKRIGNNVKRDLIIGATSLNNGQLHLFDKTDLIGVMNITDIVMSSTSIPVYFPPRLFKDQYFVDGGMFSDELINPAIQHCKTIGKNEIQIDVILTFEGLQNISNTNVQDKNIFSIMYRTYEIIENTFSNHELYTNCYKHQVKYPMYIYKPYIPITSGLLDFKHESLKKMFDMGYQTSIPTKRYYCE